jgi:hypothetical protein
MSLFEPQVTPSCLIAVVRYLLRCTKDASEKRDTLEALLMPPALRRREDGTVDEPDRPGLWETISEFKRMGMFEVTRDRIALVDGVLNQYADRYAIEKKLPLIVSDFASGRTGKPADRLLEATSWYLSLPVIGAPGKWDEIDEGDYRTTAENLGLRNSVRAPQLRHWASYLGLVWACSLRGHAFLVPDPTAQLRLRLSGLREELGAEWMPFRRFMRAISDQVPVLEGGAIRQRMAYQDRWEAESRLSTSTSLALLRLQDERRLDLVANADADIVVLDAHTRTQNISHVRILEETGAEL